MPLAPLDDARTLRTRDGTQIAYRVRRSGAGRPMLVLLHGLASNLTRWSEFVAHTDLCASWDLLRVDLRGSGGSVARGRVGMDEWCADLAAILRAEGYARAVVGGHCLGAHIALEFAARHPERAAGLVLVEPTLGPALAGSLRRIARLRPLVVAAAGLIRALNAVGVYRRALVSLDLEELDRRTRATMAARGGQAALLARYASPALDLRMMPSGVYLQALLAMAAPPPDLSAIEAPALALLSTASGFSDPAITASLLARLRRCEIVRLAAHHWIPTEQPDAMRAAIDGWCGRLIAS